MGVLNISKFSDISHCCSSSSTFHKKLNVNIQYNNMELLGKCSRGNKIAPLWHEGRAERGPSAKGVQFYCPSSTYPAIVLLVLYSIAIFLQCDPVCKKIAPLLSLDAKKLHTISLHFHKNCILKRF